MFHRGLKLRRGVVLRTCKCCRRMRLLRFFEYVHIFIYTTSKEPKSSSAFSHKSNSSCFARWHLSGRAVLEYFLAPEKYVERYFSWNTRAHSRGAQTSDCGRVLWQNTQKPADSSALSVASSRHPGPICISIVCGVAVGVVSTCGSGAVVAASDTVAVGVDSNCGSGAVVAARGPVAVGVVSTCGPRAVVAVCVGLLPVVLSLPAALALCSVQTAQSLSITSVLLLQVLLSLLVLYLPAAPTIMALVLQVILELSMCRFLRSSLSVL